MHEQSRHQGIRGPGLEDLHPEPVRSGIGRRESPILDHGAGPGGRGHREGDWHASGPSDRRAPALDALGQKVIGPLLEHHGVIDAGNLAGDVIAAQ